MFSYLIDLHGGIELDRVHRFEHGWERDASLRLRHGDPDVLDVYEAHGRIHDGPALTVQRRLLNAWWAARERGETVAVVAPTNELAAELNRAAQQRRLDAGQLPTERYLAIGDTRLHVGDEIVTRRNDRTLVTDGGRFVKNHDHWTVRRITDDRSLLVAGPAGYARLPPDYVAEHVQLGYATTSHAAQGRTVDRALLYLDAPTDCRNLYVPLTRGRHSNDIYIALRDERTARDILETSLALDRVDQPAHAARLDQPSPPSPVLDRPLEPDRLADLLVAHHRAQLALDRHQEQLDAMAAQLRQLWDRYRAIPGELGGLDAGDHRDQAEIERLKQGLGSIRNRGQVRTVQHCIADRSRQRTALHHERAELEPQLEAAEHALDDLADRGPDPVTHQLDELASQLDDDRWLRYDNLNAEGMRELQRQLGPRPTDTEVAARWDDLAGAALQQVVLDPRRHRHAYDLAVDRTDGAANQLDYHRLMQRLREPRPLSRDLGLSL